MAKEILTSRQKQFIVLFAANAPLKKHFYLTGGTALAAYYLHHRFSEDLDFFTASEVNPMTINVFLKQIKSVLGIKKTDYQQSFNRHLYFLHFTKGILKTEFTHFPFDQTAKPTLKDGLYIDSLIDIAVNKVFTIYQNPRSRDFIDLFFILREYKTLTLSQLLKLARVKFDAQIDPLQWGTQLMKVRDIADLPRMIRPLEQKTWREFFIAQAKSQSKKIFR
jgi:predicted nucleotidyltransferase component of viral defense system